MPQAALLESLVERAGRAPARAGTCRVVAIDGPSGAGKSTLADALAERLGAQIVRVDDLIPGWRGVAAGPDLVAGDVLAPIARGESGRYRRFDWLDGAYAEWCPVAQAPYLVLDGCGAGSRAIAAYLALLIWIDAPPELRRARGLARDGAVFEPFWAQWESDSGELFAREGTAARADVVLSGA